MDAYEQAIEKIKRSMGNPKTILLADDDHILRSVLRMYFESNGCNVIEARDGDEALTLYNANVQKIDILILDVRMPKLSGTEVLKEIRSTNKKIPIIILTGYPDATELSGIISNGWAVIISKPFELDHITNIFHSFFEG